MNKNRCNRISTKALIKCEKYITVRYSLDISYKNGELRNEQNRNFLSSHAFEVFTNKRISVVAFDNWGLLSVYKHPFITHNLL